MSAKGKLLVRLLLCCILSFAIHKSVCFSTAFRNTAAQFSFSVEFLYLFFGSASVFIYLFLAVLPKKHLASFGFIFIALTLAKLALTYGVFYSVISNSTASALLEKKHLFAVFSWFLAIETYFSTRILNISQ